MTSFWDYIFLGESNLKVQFPRNFLHDLDKNISVKNKMSQQDSFDAKATKRGDQSLAFGWSYGAFGFGFFRYLL